MKTIGVLRHYFLAPSETFIYRSVTGLQGRYRTRVFALERLCPGKFPLDDVTALRALPCGRAETLLYKATTWSPRWHAFLRGVDLVHAHMGYTGIYGLWAKRLLGLPLVTSYYGFDLTLPRFPSRPAGDYYLYWLLAGTLFERGDRFVVLSDDMRRGLVALGCPASKIRVVPVCVDVDRFDVPRAPREGPATVLMVGREVEKKGFDDGLRACAEARAAGADLRVVLLGTGGPLRAALQAQAEALRLDVAWPDPATPVWQAMREADVLLVPSRTAADGDREGTPTVIAEGGASGLPVVSTRHAGIPEQVDDGGTGLLADERDWRTLAGHLVRLAGDPDLRDALGRAGREKARREHSVAAHVARLAAVYAELGVEPT